MALHWYLLWLYVILQSACKCCKCYCVPKICHSCLLRSQSFLPFFVCTLCKVYKSKVHSCINAFKRTSLSAFNADTSAVKQQKNIGGKKYSMWDSKHSRTKSPSVKWESRKCDTNGLFFFVCLKSIRNGMKQWREQFKGTFVFFLKSS